MQIIIYNIYMLYYHLNCLHAPACSYKEVHVRLQCGDLCRVDSDAISTVQVQRKSITQPLMSASLLNI